MKSDQVLALTFPTTMFVFDMRSLLLRTRLWSGQQDAVGAETLHGNELTIWKKASARCSVVEAAQFRTHERPLEHKFRLCSARVGSYVIVVHTLSVNAVLVLISVF